MMLLPLVAKISLKEETIEVLEKCGKALVWWVIVAILMFIITFSLGLFSHPLNAAIKRLKKLKAKTSAVISALGSEVKTQKLVALLRLLKLKEKSVQKAVNVYIYDDQSSENTMLDSAEAKLERIIFLLDDCASLVIEQNIEEIKAHLDEIMALTDEATDGFRKVIDHDIRKKLLKV